MYPSASRLAKTGAKFKRRPVFGAGRCACIRRHATTIAIGPKPVTRKAVRHPQRSAITCATRNERPTPTEKVQRDGARGVAGGKPVRQRLQARHVGAGKSKSCQGPDRG